MTQTYKRIGPLDDGSNVYLVIDKANGCGVMSEQVRKSRLKVKSMRISRGQLYAAKLCAITAGFGYSESGAIKYIDEVGVNRFKRNTFRLKDVDKFSWEEESYLEAPNEND